MITTHRHAKTTLIAALTAGTLAVSSTAHATYSKATVEGTTVVGNGSDNFLNWGFYMAGQDWRDSTKTMIKAESFQGGAVWTRLNGKTKTLVSLETRGVGRITWAATDTAHATPALYSYAAWKGIYDGQVIMNHGASDNAGADTRTSFPRTFTKTFIDIPNLWGMSLLGVGLSIGGKLGGTAGYKLNGGGRVLKFANGNLQPESSSATGATASLTLSAYFSAGIGDLASATITTTIDVVKGTAGATVTNLIGYAPSTAKIATFWSNQAPLTASSAGGKLMVTGCLGKDNCKDKDILTWPGFPTQEKTWYKNTGSEANVAAF